MVDKDDFTIVISPRSSIGQIMEKLNKEFTNSIEFLATFNFKIYLHHTSSHEVLRQDSGVVWDDILAHGNLGLELENWRQRAAVIRFKGDVGPEPYVAGKKVPRRVYEKQEREYIQKLEAINSKISEFVAPLRKQ